MTRKFGMDQFASRLVAARAKETVEIKEVVYFITGEVLVLQGY